MVDIKRLKTYLSQPESEKLEFKRGVSKNNIKIIAKDITAMANSSGGLIIIGIDERNGIVGTNCRISEDDFKGFFKPSPKFTIEEENVDRKRLVVIEIQRSEFPILFNGVLYKRNNSHVELATDRDIRAAYEGKSNADLTKVIAEMNTSINHLQELLIEKEKQGHISTVIWSIISMVVSVMATCLVK